MIVVLPRISYIGLICDFSKLIIHYIPHIITTHFIIWQNNVIYLFYSGWLACRILAVVLMHCNDGVSKYYVTQINIMYMYQIYFS